MILYMNQILKDWHDKGINSVPEARKDHERFLQAKELMGSADREKGLKKQLDFNKFPSTSTPRKNWKVCLKT